MTRPTLALLGLYLSCALAGGVSCPAWAAPCELRCADFEDQPLAAITGEGLQPGSSVALVTDAPDEPGVALRMKYDFVAQPTGLQYVGFHTPAVLAGRPTAFSLRVYGDGSGEPLRLRLTDATGETFQYHLPEITWTGWRRVTGSLATPQVYWTGNGDGKWDLPVQLDSVLVDSVNRPRQGVLYFDDLTYSTDAEPVDLVQAQIGSDAFGGVAWGPDAPLAGSLSLTNVTVDQTLSGAVRISLSGPSGRELGPMSVDFTLGPGDRSRASLPTPGTEEGLIRVAAEVEVAGATRHLDASFARFRNPEPDAQDPGSFFGTTTHFGQGKGNNPGTFDLMSRAGVKWLRDEISWGSVEARKGQYEIPAWADAYMQGAVAHGITPLIILDYGNGAYDNGGAPTSPEAQAAFGEYCFQMVSHFKGVCRHWEIYNEPNIGFWQPKPDPVAYARLLKIAYRRCKEADPGCTVVGICTAGTDLAYIETVLKEGAGPFMDALSVHPYRYPGSPEATGFVAELTRAHELMARYGIGDKKLWLTEIGWPTHTTAGGVTETVSGDYFARMHTLARALPFVERVFWYDFQDDGLDSGYNEHNFGLVRWITYTPKANYVAARVTAEHLKGVGAARQLLPASAGDKRYVLAFARLGKPMIAAWADGVTETVALQVGAPRVELQWTDARREVRDTLDGVLTVTLGDMPVFITGARGEVALAPAPVKVELSPSPLAPGETVLARVTVPAGTRPALELSPGLPLSRPFPSGWRPGVFTMRVRHNAAACSGTLTLRALDGRGREVARAATTVRVVAPLEVGFDAPRLQTDGAVTVSARLRNTRQIPLPLRSFQISGGRGGVAGGGVLPARLEPGQTVTLPGLATLGPTPPGLGRTVALNVVTAAGATVSQVRDMGLWLVPRAKTAPVVDGELADWDQVPAASLGGRPGNFIALREGVWSGAPDQSAVVGLQWTPEALYLVALVTDDAHVQTRHGAEVWNSDGVQFSLDGGLGARLAWEAGDRVAYPEIGLTRTDTGDELIRWLWHDGVPAGAKLATKRSGNTTVYEASVPWGELAAGAPRPGDLAGFALLINEDDGQGRDGWLELYSGIGYQKDPRLFGVLRFAP